MSLVVERAVREFKYNGMALQDPGAQLSAEEVKAFYANLYPELNNAAIEGPEQVGAKLVYEFRRAVGTKGADGEGRPVPPHRSGGGHWVGPPQHVPQITPGVMLIMKERDRQIREEGWSADHDDEHRDGSLAIAAACYALPESHRKLYAGVPVLWPWAWNVNWWKPKDRIRDLTRAGALIAAEIDRLLREQSKEPQ